MLNFSLLAFAAGLICASFLDSSGPAPYFGVCCAALFFFSRHSTRRSVFLGLGCLFFVGLSLYPPLVQPPHSDRHIIHFCKDTLQEIEGRVLRVERRAFDRAFVDVECQKIKDHGQTFLTSGKVRLYTQYRPAVVPGDRVRFQSKLRHVCNFGTPGEFDWARHLAHQKIYVTGYISAKRPLSTLSETPPSLLAGGPPVWREWLNQHIDDALPSCDAPLVRALVTGSKGDLPEEVKRLAAQGGISHLFAISGLHFGILAYALYLLLRFFYRRSERLMLWSPPGRVLPLVILPPLGLYLCLSGNGLATGRAFAVAALAALMLYQQRRVRPQDLLSSALFIILLLDPLALFEPSLQLSAAGAFGILLIQRPWLKRLGRLPRLLGRPLQLLAVSIAASLATIPLALLHFHQYAPAAPMSNLWAVPLVSLGSVPLALFGAFLAPFSLTGANYCWQGAAAVLHLVFAGLQTLLAMPGLAGDFLYLRPIQTCGIFLFCWSILLLTGSKHKRGFFLSLTILGLSLLAAPKQNNQQLQITMLSVGQGESMILQLPDGRDLLIDGGGLYSSTFDTGERLVAPALARLGIDHLNAVVLSHPHPDHYRGLSHILQHFPVDEFWCSVPETDLPEEIDFLLKQHHIPQVCFPAGWQILTDNLKLQFAAFVPKPGHLTVNDRSLVLYAGDRQHGVLLTGDIEAEGVRQLLTNKPPGPVDLLKIPHHGSRYSDPETLIPTLQPQFAFVSLGKGNPFGFPHFQVSSILAAHDIPLLRTDRDGSVRFVLGALDWRVENWKTGFFIDKIPSDW